MSIISEVETDKWGEKMKLYYLDQRKMFPFKAPIEIWDERADVCYIVKTNGKLGIDLCITNTQGEPIVAVKQKFLSLNPKFILKASGEEILLTLKHRMNGEAYCTVGDNMTAEGDIYHRRYELRSGDKAVAYVRRTVFSKGQIDPTYIALCKKMNMSENIYNDGNCCELEILSETDEIKLLAIAVAVEAAIIIKGNTYN